MKSTLPLDNSKGMALRSKGAIAALVGPLGLFSLAAAAPPADSPFDASPSHRYGQVRTRTEYNSKNMADTSANKAALSTGLRTRLGFSTNPSENVQLKVELQDSRNFGSEPRGATSPASASVGNSKGVDLLQGYFAITQGDFQLALGRQKMSLGSGRFLSTLEWHPVSRAFDGVSFNWGFEPGNLTGFFYTVADDSPAAIKDAAAVGGLYYSHSIKPGVTADVFGFYDMSRLPSTYAGDVALNYDLVYFGERFAGKFGMFNFEEEFIWQGGEMATATGDMTNAAFQFGLRAGATIGTSNITLGLDGMSGDDKATDDEIHTYRANYFFGHAYFGWMDYFLNNPKSGVMDYRIDASIPFLPNAAGKPTMVFKPAYHFFTPQAAPSGMDDPYGQEIDAELHITYFPKSNIVLGAGVFIAGDGAINMPGSGLTAGKDDKPGLFLYFMPIFNF